MSWKATAYVKELIVCPNGQRITAVEKLVLFVLADYHHTKQNIVWPSQETLAEEALCSERTVRRVISSLVEKGVLEVASRQGGGKSAVYHFTDRAVPRPQSRPDNMSGQGIQVRPDTGGHQTGQQTGQGEYRNKEVPVTTQDRLEPSASAVPDSKESPDPRHSIVRERFKVLWLAHAQKTATADRPAPKTAPWNGRDAGILSKLLTDNPSWSSKFLTFCLESYFQSEGITGGDPFWAVVPRLTRYSSGPIDSFKKPLTRARDSQDAPDGLAEARRQRAAGRGSSEAGEGS
jgi:hypothetical protein